MIRKARFSDRRYLFDIWKNCFGDSKEYIEFFLENGFSKDNCLIWDEGGKPVSMLHLRMGEYIPSDNEFFKNYNLSVMYIYAAATLPEFQNHGIMSALINAVNRIATEKGYLFTFLLPGNEGLYNYYSKLGYITSFQIKKAVLSREDLITFSALNNYSGVGASIAEQRKSFFVPSVKWNDKELSYAIKEWQLVSGEVLRFAGGYLLSRQMNDTVEVKEICGDFKTAAYTLLNRYKASKYSILIAPQNDYPFKTTVLKYGMMRAESEKISEKIKSEQAYVNLLLD